MSDSPPIATLGPSLIAVGGIALALGAVGLGVMISKQRPAAPAPTAAVQVAAPAPVAAAPAAMQDAAAPPVAQAEPEPEQLRLIVKRVSSLPALADPFAPVWFDAPAVDVPLEPQVLTNPMLDEATVQSARVRAATDGRQIAWLISWEDENAASSSDTGTFSDAAALQFPLVPYASYMMGAEEMPVHILYWRAQWQKDIDDGFQDMLALYPNFWSDVYWFSTGTFPHPVSDSFDDPRSHQWFVAREAGNPMADFERSNAVDEMIAEGYGTLTHNPNGSAGGRGVWRDGRWHVVIVRPIGRDDLSKQFQPGETSEFGVAIWDGNAANVGGRKHHSFWIPFEVER